MRIERVIARAFGPFVDESLELAPGMTVVVGPNEAGKSTWHAATRLAITGMRRGRGRATSADQAIEARHRPWDAPDRWEVEARLALADGRTIDIAQDLAGKVACRATDVALGRDVSDEILDGTPDASIWLGLDRESFAATVSVSQAQIASVANAETAELLQQHMQRAAATRGTDATAAEAIDRLTEFRRSVVGADTVAAKGPLRAAKVQLTAAQERVAEATARHAAYLERAAAAEGAEQRLLAARQELAVAEAVVARRAADAAAQRCNRAEELAARHPDAPEGISARDATADAVATALEGWERRPRPSVSDGPDSAMLQATLDALPPPPVGDLRPHPSVVDGLRALELAEGALADHGAPPPEPDPGVAPAGPTAPAARPAAVLAAWIVAGVAGIAGAGLVLAGALPGIVLLTVAAGAAGFAWWLAGDGRRVAAQAAAEVAVQRAMAAERQSAWRARRDALTARRDAAESALTTALAERGEDEVPATGALRDAAARYLAACDERAAQAATAGRRELLERELAARRALERAAAEARTAVDAARAALRSAADRIGLHPDATTEQMVTALQSWQRDRADRVRLAEAELAEWQELRAILGDDDLDAIRAEAERRAVDAARRAAAVPEGLPDPLPRVDAPELDARRARVADAERASADLLGELRVVRAALPDVAEAEEALVAAETELRRVEDLSITIDTALRLLRSAEERVHRNLAPILADAVRRWLPVVSRGAYEEVSVDPANLAVKVREAATGQWRDARLLSEGTREQIYLLLRVAMAQHLVRPGEVAPLLLDEVTAQSDAARKRELLDVLHELSAERQVVLFSHDDDVAAWAAGALVEPRDAIVRLAAGATRGTRLAVAEDEERTALPVG